MFYCCFFSGTAALYLWAASADRRENLKYVHLDTVGPKIGGLPQNNFGGYCFFAFRSEISELPPPIAVKLCQMMENKSSFKS